MSRLYLSASSLSSSEWSHAVSLITSEEQRQAGSRVNVANLSTTHGGLVHDVTDGDCKAQNGAHGGSFKVSVSFDLMFLSRVFSVGIYKG